MTGNPKKLTRKEWREIASIPAVHDAWGLNPANDNENFTHAVRFDYVSDGPGYAGVLFVLLGGDPNCPPMILTRRNGELVVEDSSDY
jgi:hypothetical protein